MNKVYSCLLLLLLSAPAWAQQEITDTLKKVNTLPPVAKPPISLQQKDDYYKSSTGLPDMLEIPPENEEEQRRYYTVRGYLQDHSEEYNAWHDRVYGADGIKINLGKSFQLSGFQMLLVKLQNAGVSFSAPVSVRQSNESQATNIRMPETGMKPQSTGTTGNWYIEIEKNNTKPKRSPYLLDETGEEVLETIPDENPLKYMELIAQYVAH